MPKTYCIILCNANLQLYGVKFYYSEWFKDCPWDLTINLIKYHNYSYLILYRILILLLTDGVNNEREKLKANLIPWMQFQFKKKKKETKKL